jgi:hypothetical protein
MVGARLRFPQMVSAKACRFMTAINPVAQEWPMSHSQFHVPYLQANILFELNTLRSMYVWSGWIYCNAAYWCIFQLALNYQKAEFYVSCAQVRVINGGSGEPKPLVALPGYYTGREPGIMVNIYSESSLPKLGWNYADSVT